MNLKHYSSKIQVFTKKLQINTHINASRLFLLDFVPPNLSSQVIKDDNFTISDYVNFFLINC